ncbi:F-box protein [Arachis hypogaea]|uniref:F-box protein n=1 Tax=Arachis hypogaea TaxID=3818 RepID=A0A6B9VD87_ARAHY|nr:F-box protein [Arachis hypogaea]
MLSSIVRWSHGSLTEIRVRHCSDRSLALVAESCPNLEVLSIRSCPHVTDDSISRIALRCPKLRELDVSYCYEISHVSLALVGKNCPNLKVLKRNLMNWLDPSLEISHKNSGDRGYEDSGYVYSSVGAEGSMFQECFSEKKRGAFKGSLVSDFAKIWEDIWELILAMIGLLGRWCRRSLTRFRESLLVGRGANKAGRLCLVNAVMASIPVYNMQVFLLRKYACNKSNSLMRQFLWKGQANGRGLPLIKWDIAITPKKAGGLGVRDTLYANIALLGKLIWDCLNNRNKLWVQVLTHKYLRNSKDMGSNRCHHASTTWRNILKAYDILKEGFRWNVKNMQQSIWYDEWCPLGKLCELTSYVHIFETNFSLTDLWGNGTWEGDKLATPISYEVK